MPKAQRILKQIPYSTAEPGRERTLQVMDLHRLCDTARIHQILQSLRTSRMILTIGRATVLALMEFGGDFCGRAAGS